MRAAYLVRFDDICPTMNWDVWERIERVLEAARVRPLLSVVPDNRDERLRIEVPAADFWDRVRAWQERGWTIGAHGYQHRYVSRNRGLYGWNDRSEFAGLPRDEQGRKVRRALDIFRREEVQPEVWVAPNHSFDTTTLTVLREAGLRVICDGLSLFPFVDRQGMTWIPQQLWRFRPRPLGVWTVCLHHNRWPAARVGELERDLARYREQIVGVSTVLRRYEGRRRGFLDDWFLLQRRAKRRVRTLLDGAEA